jgi:hypothetical protein
MNQSESLSGSDRATLWLWRVTNVVGWSLLALVAAGFLRLVAASVADLFLPSRISNWGMGYGLPVYVSYGPYLEVPSSLAIGIAIGSIVGSRVYRAQAITAGIVAGIYAVPGFLYVQRFAHLFSVVSRSSDRWFVLVAIAATIPIAAWVAHRVSQKRPRALRTK